MKLHLVQNTSQIPFFRNRQHEKKIVTYWDALKAYSELDKINTYSCTYADINDDIKAYSELDKINTYSCTCADINDEI